METRYDHRKSPFSEDLDKNVTYRPLLAVDKNVTSGYIHSVPGEGQVELIDGVGGGALQQGGQDGQVYVLRLFTITQSENCYLWIRSKNMRFSLNKY